MKKITLALVLLLPVSFLSSVEPAQAVDWYMKAEVGYSGSEDTEFTVTDQLGQGDTSKGKTLGSSFLYGIGAGLKFNDALRAEINVQFRNDYEIEHYSSVSYPIKYESEVSSQLAFANLYYDFDKIRLGNVIVLPFVGGGVGLSENEMDDVEYGGPPASPVVIEGDTSSEFSWNVAVGVGFDLENDFMLDVGYRYIDLGDVESGDVIIASPLALNLGQIIAEPLTGELTAHEIFIDLRYMF